MKKIWLDVDTGVDDALAIMLAMRVKELELLGISTVAGNCDVEQATKNTCAILDLLGDKTMLVAKGMAQPLVRPWVHAADVHGESGLGDLQLAVQSERVVERNGIAYLIEQIMASRERLILVTLGPLTNIAIALLQEPRLREKIDEIVVMGGAGAQGGNVTPVAEFNLYVDPDAAKIVFHSGLAIRLITWDLTLQAWLKESEIQCLHQAQDPVARTAAKAIRFLQSRFGHQVPLCDPAAVAAVIDSSMVESNTYPVDVETRGELTRGMTIIDRRLGLAPSLATDQRPRIEVGEELDRDRFAQLLLTAYSALEPESRNK